MLLWWRTEEASVKRITLDTDASGGTSDEIADGIDVSLRKLDIHTNRYKLAGHHGKAASGGGAGNSLMEDLLSRNRVNTISENLSWTCNNHGLNLVLSIPTLQSFP